MVQTNEKIAPQKSSLGEMDANVLALLTYLAPIILSIIPIIGYVAWAAPLVVFLIEKKSSFVRFHAMQALLLIAVWVVITIIFAIIGAIAGGIYAYSGFGFALGFGFIGILMAIIGLGLLVLVIVAMVKAYGYQQWKLPLIGNLAEKWSPIK